MKLLASDLPQQAPAPPVWCTVSASLWDTTGRGSYALLGVVLISKNLLEWCVPGATASPNTDEQLAQEISATRRQAFCAHDKVKTQIVTVIHTHPLLGCSRSVINSSDNRGVEKKTRDRERYTDCFPALSISHLQSSKDSSLCGEWLMEEWGDQSSFKTGAGLHWRSCQRVVHLCWWVFCLI